MMIGHFLARLKRFARNCEGATMVEFALVFPLVLTITLGTMEISLYMASLVTLEGGLREASRYAITSQSPTAANKPNLNLVPVPFKKDPDDYRTQMIGLILNQHTLHLINLDDATVDTTTYDQFMLIKDGEPYNDANGNGKYDLGEKFDDIACPPGNGVWDGPKSTGTGVGAPGAIVVYNITYNWRFFTPLIGKLLGKPDPKNPNSYILPIGANIVVKNEPTLSGSTFAC